MGTYAGSEFYGAPDATANEDPLDQATNADPMISGAGLGGRMARYQNLGSAAANHGTYQLNWQGANAAQQQGQEARGYEGDAMGYAQQVANGADTQAQQIGRQQLQTGLQNQQAVAQSTRGGSLAQAAAVQQQQQGAGAFMQAGNQQLSIQHAQEMAQAREQYMQGANAMRSGDLSAQNLAEQQAAAQQKQEIGQRSLNDQGQLGYEGMAVDEAGSQLNNQTHGDAVAAQKSAARDASNQADDNRFQQLIGAGAGMFGGAASGLVGLTHSDARMKGGIVPLTEEPGTERHWDADVASGRPDAMSGASLTGPVPRYGIAEAAARAKPSEAAPKTRKLTDAELDKMAAELQASTRGQAEGHLAAGPSVKGDPMTSALAEGLKPYQYEYRPEYAAREGQRAGEKNVGPMAQDMASNPITGQAVQQGPDGMLRIDLKKATKLSLAAAGHNAQKLREQQAQIDALRGGR